MDKISEYGININNESIEFHYKEIEHIVTHSDKDQNEKIGMISVHMDRIDYFNKRNECITDKFFE